MTTLIDPDKIMEAHLAALEAMDAYTPQVGEAPPIDFPEDSGDGGSLA